MVKCSHCDGSGTMKIEVPKDIEFCTFYPSVSINITRSLEPATPETNDEKYKKGKMFAYWLMLNACGTFFDGIKDGLKDWGELK